jgi:hypothetical protein
LRAALGMCTTGGPGEREELADSGGLPLNLHEMDEMYGPALAKGGCTPP